MAGGAERNGGSGVVEFDFRGSALYSEATHKVEIEEHEKEFGLTTDE